MGKLGVSWRKLRVLKFEVDANYRNMKVYYDQVAVERWRKQSVPCDNLRRSSRERERERARLCAEKMQEPGEALSGHHSIGRES